MLALNHDSMPAPADEKAIAFDALLAGEKTPLDRSCDLLDSLLSDLTPARIDISWTSVVQDGPREQQTGAGETIAALAEPMMVGPEMAKPVMAEPVMAEPPTDGPELTDTVSADAMATTASASSSSAADRSTGPTPAAPSPVDPAVAELPLAEPAAAVVSTYSTRDLALFERLTGYRLAPHRQGWRAVDRDGMRATADDRLFTVLAEEAFQLADRQRRGGRGRALPSQPITDAADGILCGSTCDVASGLMDLMAEDIAVCVTPLRAIAAQLGGRGVQAYERLEQAIASLLDRRRMA